MSPHFYDSSCDPLHLTRLPAAGPPTGESGEVRGCDPDAAASEREKPLLPVHRGARGQHEEKEEAEKREKEEEGQAAEARAGEEEVV